MKRGTKIILGLTAVATAACAVGVLNKRRKKYGTRLIDEALNMFCKPCNKYAEDDFEDEDDDFEDEDDDLIFDDPDLFVEPGETQVDTAETESDTVETEAETAETE